SADAEPIFVGVCHCTNCQKGSGTAFNAVVAMPKPAVGLTGTVSTYEGRGDTGNATYKHFCPECGSPIAEEAAVMADVMMIAIGTLDDPSAVQPAMQIYCDSAQPWALLEGGIQRFPKMPMPG
ncbi:MAG TPA: GFA family protein, partial [Stellaceae bacterium]|nr:GFA family protein [Stellaceae bacterium]